MVRLIFVVAAAGAFLLISAGSGRADGDPEKGKRAFNKCKTCHELTAEKNKIGPHMVGLFGRKSGSVAGFKYSPQMQGANVVWDEKTIDTYIADPKKFVPGNKMVLAPIKDAAERADIIAYLKQQQKK